MDTTKLREIHAWWPQPLYEKHNKTILALCDEVDRLRSRLAEVEAERDGSDALLTRIGEILDARCGSSKKGITSRLWDSLDERDAARSALYASEKEKR